MSRNEYEAWMFFTYSDFVKVVEDQGIAAVLQDLEDHHPRMYETLIQGVMERAKVNKEVPCLLLRTPDSSNGESR